jgi:hypothetical protein
MFRAVRGVRQQIQEAASLLSGGEPTQDPAARIIGRPRSGVSEEDPIEQLLMEPVVQPEPFNTPPPPPISAEDEYKSLLSIAAPPRPAPTPAAEPELPKTALGLYAGIDRDPTAPPGLERSLLAEDEYDLEPRQPRGARSR